MLERDRDARLLKYPRSELPCASDDTLRDQLALLGIHVGRVLDAWKARRVEVRHVPRVAPGALKAAALASAAESIAISGVPVPRV